MRTIVGVGLAVGMTFIGAIALSEAAQQSEQTATNTSAGADAWNVSVDVFGGIGQAAAPAIVWMGVAAIVLVAVGLLVMAGNNGRGR